MQIKIRHTTEYSYDQPVDYGLQKVRLHPLNSAVQDVSDWQMQVEGGKIEASYQDHYGNHTDLVSITPGAEKLTLTASGIVHTRDTAGVFGHIYGRAPLWHFLQSTHMTTADAHIQELAKVVGAAETTLAGLHALSAAVLNACPYHVGNTQAETTAAEALKIGTGVCQDHAHIFMAAARHIGMPARYVSGYLMVNGQINQEASHAWAEAHIAELGWVGFDISNGVAPDEKYVRIAVGRDARDAAPVSGMRMGNSDEDLIVYLQVQQ
ncbi:transglutaminase domain-containing protein [Loktanella agnita]|uniref:transglutaminase family protein n=1 Tax=Loktanella agnita TaxID=287097 RepID=UPI003987E959